LKRSNFKEVPAITKVKWDQESGSSALKRIGEKLHIARHPLKEKIAHAIIKLRSQRDTLEQTSARLHQRDREIFERCIGAHLSKDHSHAAMYANECAEVRKMAKLVISGELALERVVLRLETIEEFGDVLAQMAPVMGIIKETRSRLAGVLPEVAMELDSINSLLNNTLVETGEVQVGPASLEASNEEAIQVLNEANIVAEQKMKEQFPEIPSIVVPVKLAEGLSAGMPRLDDEVALDQRVYDYIKKYGGTISLSRCASDLKTTQNDVKKAIDKLRDEGKITL